MGYLFTSERLGFRNWTSDDLDKMYSINSDKEVMEFFPSQPTRKETIDFITRMQTSFAKNGYCYFAVEIINTQEFIGFIGLSIQTFEADFTPMTDIGWRLKKSSWGKGFATEGAKACVKYGFEDLNLKTIHAIAPKLNTKSQHVMTKIGMTESCTFIHPKINKDHTLKNCVLFKISNKSNSSF